MRHRLSLAVVVGLVLRTPSGCVEEAPPVVAPSVSLVMPAKVAPGAKVSVEGAYSLSKAGLEVSLAASECPTNAKRICSLAGLAIAQGSSSLASSDAVERGRCLKSVVRRLCASMAQRSGDVP